MISMRMPSSQLVFRDAQRAGPEPMNAVFRLGLMGPVFMVSGLAGGARAPGGWGWTFPLASSRQTGSKGPSTTHRGEGERPMEEISVIGIDLAKRVFQLCAM